MSRRAEALLWTALSLAAALGILVDLSRRYEPPSRIVSIPVSGLGFASTEVPLNQSERGIYSRADVIKRCYQVGKNRFLLIAIDGTRNRHAVHDPLFCFTGAGWKVASREDFPLESGQGALLHLRRKGERQDVLYWFSDGRSRHASVVRYWIQATLRRVTLGRSGKEPILVMIQSVSGEPVDFPKVIEMFGVLSDI